MINKEHANAYKQRIKSLSSLNDKLQLSVNEIEYIDDMHFEDSIYELMQEITDQITYLTGELNAAN